MTTALPLTHEIHFDDQAVSFDDLEAFDDAELNVTRTPKSIVLALVVACVACLLAYLQSPNTVEVHHQSRGSANDATRSNQVLQVGYEEYWTTAEVAPMTLGLDG